jgi:hypothetical protein
MRLAKKFGASNYSSFRRYAATNPGACCVVVLESVVQRSDGKFRAEVRRIIPSRTFNTIYGSLRIFSAITETHAVASIIPLGRRMTKPRELVLVDRNNDRRECVAEAFDTTHQIFLLIRDVGEVKRSTIIKPGSLDYSATLGRLRQAL